MGFILKKSLYIVLFIITYIPFQSRFLEYLIPQHGSNLSLNGYIVFIYLFALLLMLPQSFYEVMCETTRLEYFNIKIGCLGRCAYRLFTQHLLNISIDIFCLFAWCDAYLVFIRRITSTALPPII